MPKKRKKKAPVIACGVAVIRREHEFLIAQRNPSDTFGSFWEFPGGRKNPGETFEQCVVREVKEELGVDVSVERKLMEIRRQFEERVIWLNFYLCEYRSGDPQPLDCQQVRWTDAVGLKEFRFPPANERVIDALIKEYASQKP